MRGKVLVAVAALALAVVVLLAFLARPVNLIGGVDVSWLEEPLERTCSSLRERLGPGRCVATTGGRVLFFSVNGKYLGSGEVR